ncbi:CAP domain-containing protein [Thermoflexus sp.]|uniref:CAP domain-containing protein n=1 Tax=Thermoflexus sp. TaxID=1969742 RepID=UPI0035E433D3
MQRRWGIRRGTSALALMGILLGMFFHSGSPQSASSLLLGPGSPVEAAETAATYRVFLPLVLRAPASALPEWLSRLNAYRAMAGLPPVAENPEWNEGCSQHARYMVKNDVITHREDPNNPWYTPEGDTCGRNANVMVSSNATASDAYAIDVWMQAPFHAVGMLDPRLMRVGYGSYREADGGWQMGAALDVIRGLGTSVAGVSLPIRWPGDGSTTSLRAFRVGEYPDPLAHCRYTAPTGVPILLLLGTGSLTPNVTAHSLKRDEVPVEHCVFDETTYTNPTDPNQQQLGRLILDSRDAIVILPKDPLSPGSRYTVSVTVNGQTYTWSFYVASSGIQAAAGQEQDVKIR